MMIVKMPRMVRLNENNNTRPNTPRKMANVTGIRSGKIKINAPVTIGMAEIIDGSLKARNNNPSATR